MNKISYGQFSAMLLVSDAFALVCFSQKMSVFTAISFISALIIQFVILLPFLRKGGHTEKKWVLWIYLVAAVLWESLLFIRVWEIAETIYIPLPDWGILLKRLIISALIALVCLYASSPGIKAISRAAVITAGFGVICIAVIITGSIKVIKAENLQIPENAGIFSQITAGLSLSGGVCIFPYLSEKLKDSKKKSAVCYFLCRTVFFTAVTILTVLTSGGIMEIAKFPVIRAAQLCQPFSSQRADALFIIVLVILAIVAISVNTVTASQIIENIFPKFRRFKSTFVLAVTLILALILGKTNLYSIVYAVSFLIPLIVSGLLSIKKGGTSK